MEPLFRMMLMRPPVGPDPEAPSLSLVQDSPLQKDLAHAAQQADTVPADQMRAAYQQLAREFVTGSDYIADPGQTPQATPLAAFAAALDAVVASSATPATVAQAVETAFGRPAAEVAADPEVLAAGRRLRDSLIVIKLLPEEHQRPVEELVRQLLDLILGQQGGARLRVPRLGRCAEPLPAPFALRYPPLPGLSSVLSTAELEKHGVGPARPPWGGRAAEDDRDPAGHPPGAAPGPGRAIRGSAGRPSRSPAPRRTMASPRRRRSARTSW